LDLVAPVRSRRGEAEHLDDQFEDGQFHLVYMRYALDHCYDPVGALRQMVRAVRPGGIVMVEHYRDQTQTEYQGLRHWNLHPEADDLVIANSDHTSRVSSELPGVDLQMG
jgi:ubiquinone/menaquinone biosynthesis C-methylase UbiE